MIFVLASCGSDAPEESAPVVGQDVNIDASAEVEQEVPPSVPLVEVVDTAATTATTATTTTTAAPSTVTTAGIATTPAAEPETTAAPTTTVELTTTTTEEPTTTAAPTTTEAPTTTTAPPLPAAPVGPTPGLILTMDFEGSPLGSYGDDRIKSEWSNIRFAKTGGRASIEDEAGNRFVRIRFPEGGVGTNDGGSLWQVDLEDESATELYASYRVRFVGDFDFVKGGKLPGFGGGENNTGGEKPNGTDGWSARGMWRTDGRAVQYVYHPDQPSNFGEDLEWGLNFPRNQWVTVETRVRMNTPGQRNGIVESWLNGRKVLSQSNLRFRDTDSFEIDSFLFHTFFGGSSNDWAPSKDEAVDFDNLVISGSPITH